MNIIGQPFTLAEFPAYLAALPPMRWEPSAVVLHHTAVPSLAQRPDGFTAQHMQNLMEFYEGLGWRGGPHLFVDDHRVWVFSPLTERGTHAVSFNAAGFGIEVLGDYDNEDPATGRGLSCWRNAAVAFRSLCAWRGIDPAGALKFHRDDPKTRKTCPGKRVTRDWFLAL